MAAYLKIENLGVCPVQGFTLLGASITRNESGSNSALIGQFGSGNKHGVATALRHGLPPVVFLDRLKLEFDVRTEVIDDGLSKTNTTRIVVKYGGVDGSGKSKSSTEDLGFVLEYGASDWPNVSMALREFVSNAIDRQIRQTGDFKGVKVEIVEEGQVRAKAGSTRVFVPLSADVLEFYNHLGQWFLHFSEPGLLNQTVLPKNNRNIGEAKVAVIYRRGVRVREWSADSQPSLFDYNLNDLTVDEARNCEDFTVRNKAGRALSNADAGTLATYFRSFKGETGYWEHGFDYYSLEANWSDTGAKGEAKQKAWSEALADVMGVDGVICDDKAVGVVERKGFNTLPVPEAVVRAADSYKVRTPNKVLCPDSREGREVIEPTADALAALDLIWQTVVDTNLTNGKNRPEVKCFKAVVENSKAVDSYYRDNTVFISADMGAEGSAKIGWHALSDRLLIATLEQVGHHLTSASDYSKDFQGFFIRLSVLLARKLAMPE